MAADGKDFSAHIRAMSPRDMMVVGGGLAVLVLSFFPFVGVSFGPFSVSHDAWTSYASLGLLLLLAVAVLWGLPLFGVAVHPKLPIPLPRAYAIGAGVGTLLVLLRGLTYSSESIGGRSLGLGFRFGGILLIIAAAVVTAGAVWADRTSSATPDKP